jgi:hypothetical protein
MWRFALAGLIAGGIQACERTDAITKQPFQLGSTPVKISMTTTGVTVGPQREVCLVVSPSTADSVDTLLARNASRRSPIYASLTTKEGLSDTLGGNGILQRRGNMLCLQDRGLATAALKDGKTRRAERADTPQSARYVTLGL